MTYNKADHAILNKLDAVTTDFANYTTDGWRAGFSGGRWTISMDCDLRVADAYTRSDPDLVLALNAFLDATDHIPDDEPEEVYTCAQLFWRNEAVIDALMDAHRADITASDTGCQSCGYGAVECGGSGHG